MGRWGIGIFDDDSAYDFVDEIKEDAFSFFHQSFEKAIKSEFIEFTDCHAVTVSGAYLNNFLHKTQYRTDGDYEDYDVNDFYKITSFVVKDIENLKKLAIEALEKVISENSELYQLYEDWEKYEEWKQTIQALIDRLK